MSSHIQPPLDDWAQGQSLQLPLADPSLVELAAYRQRVAGAFAEVLRQIEALDINLIASEGHAAKLLREDAVKIVRAAAETLGVEGV